MNISKSIYGLRELVKEHLNQDMSAIHHVNVYADTLYLQRLTAKLCEKKLLDLSDHIENAIKDISISKTLTKEEDFKVFKMEKLKRMLQLRGVFKLSGLNKPVLEDILKNINAGKLTSGETYNNGMIPKHRQ